MNINISSVKNYLNDKKVITIVITTFIIGIGVITTLNLLSKKQSEDTSSFKSLDNTLAEVGAVQGESVAASPSATLTPTRTALTSYHHTPTARPTLRPTTPATTSTSGSSVSSNSNPTATPTKAPTASPSNPTATPKPTATSGVIPTSTPIPATPAPTATSTVTPTPGFSASIGTSVNTTDNTLTTSINGNREVALCMFQYLNEQGGLIDQQGATGSGMSCSQSRSNDSEIVKIKVLVNAMNTSDSQITVEKSAPF